MSLGIIFIFAVSVMGLVYFTLRFIQLKFEHDAMSAVEERYNEIRVTQEKSATKNSRLTKIHRQLQESGWPVDIFVVVATTAFGYLAIAVTIKIAGASILMSALLAIPVAVVLVWFLARYLARRKVNAFNLQMVLFLDMLVAQVRAGVGVQRSIMVITKSLPEPLQSEMTKVVAAASTGSDLLTELQKLADKYPSRAFSMFLAALDIDRTEGHRLGPALEQAALLLKRSFTLQAEARAELSSTKWEFIGVTAIIVGITVKLMLSNDPMSASAYTNPLGLFIIVLALLNVVWGIFRFNRMIDKLSKEVTQ